MRRRQEPWLKCASCTTAFFAGRVLDGRRRRRAECAGLRRARYGCCGQFTVAVLDGRKSRFLICVKLNPRSRIPRIPADSTDFTEFFAESRNHGIKPFLAPSGVLALFCPGAESRIPRGTDSTESRIPRGGIPAAKPLCPRLPYPRQLELLVFGPRPAAGVGEGGLPQMRLLAVPQKTTLDTRGWLPCRSARSAK
jgi:hypothetical protein